MRSRTKKRFSGRRVAYLGLLTALAVIMGYVEYRIPFHFFVPGVKLGLSNIVILLVLYLYGLPEAFSVSFIRIAVIGMIFGNPVSVIYSIAGTAAGISGMFLLKKTGRFSIVGVSVSGAVLHHMGQLLAASALTGTAAVFRYAPVLLLAGEVTGALIGALDAAVLKRLGTAVQG